MCWSLLVVVIMEELVIASLLTTSDYVDPLWQCWSHGTMLITYSGADPKGDCWSLVAVLIPCSSTNHMKKVLIIYRIVWSVLVVLVLRGVPIGWLFWSCVAVLITFDSADHMDKYQSSAEWFIKGKTYDFGFGHIRWRLSAPMDSVAYWADCWYDVWGIAWKYCNIEVCEK